VAGVVSSTGVPSDFGFLRGRRVLVTGHTGFKGAWLTEWLLQLGADVHGIALAPDSDPSLFDVLGLANRMDHVVADIRDAERLQLELQRIRPELVFHLAAQPLVRRSYREPVATWATNVLGTLHVLEAVRALNQRVVVVAVTTDKVYRNREWVYAYREVDELGGHDPYSASKAACEIAVESWRASFGGGAGVRVASARAGNVLGGGDFAEDRIVPDCYRAWARGSAVELRHPGSTRPWQHVLEPLSGYLRLAHHLDSGEGPHMTSCNFGPGPGGDRPVRELVDALAAFGGPRPWIDASAPGAVHEARALSLSVDRARHELGWEPRLTFQETLAWVDAGYAGGPDALPAVVHDQIRSYQQRCTR